MKFIIGIVFFSFTLTAFGQDYPDSGFTNKAEAKNLTVNGKKEGKWVEYRDSNLTKTKDSTAPYYMLTVYKTDKPNGIIRGYYKSGKLMSSATYVNGKKNGVAKLYFESGKLRVEGAYIDGIENGVISTYYENGTLNLEIPCTDGKKDGMVKLYYENGTLLIESPYTNGIQNGVTKKFHQNGGAGAGEFA